MKLNVKAFALTGAIVWGLLIFILTWWIILFEGQADPDAPAPFIGLIYRGYSLTTAGSFIGLAWAVTDGLILGAIFAWLYNKLAGK